MDTRRTRKVFEHLHLHISSRGKEIGKEELKARGGIIIRTYIQPLRAGVDDNESGDNELFILVGVNFALTFAQGEMSSQQSVN